MTSADVPTVLSTQQSGVTLLELSRPQAMNAIDTQMKRDLLAALEAAARDPHCRAIVLTGSGKAFCTGSDLKAGGGPDKTQRGVARALLHDYLPVLDLIVRMDKPVIAAVNGPAAGMGMSIALACDLMIVAQGAYLMSPFVNIGLIPDGGAAWFLIRRVGYTRAFDLLTSGQKLSAEQCLAWGIANRVAAPMALRDEALTWAAQLADSAPLAIAMTKRALRLSQTTGLADMLGVEADLQVACYASEDSREARAAFVEKRKPTFRGQ